MKIKIQEFIEIPEGIECKKENTRLICTKGALENYREINIPGIQLKVETGKILLICEKGNKNELKAVRSQKAHIMNMICGLQKPFTYKLEVCNVHFPMTLKVEGNKLVISNFLGERVSRVAEILPGVNIEIKGQKIILFSHNLEAAGQTAANIERATKVKNRDRRIFQDGIFIVEKPEAIK
jgi:large subunit ribosomal protein L6